MAVDGWMTSDRVAERARRLRRGLESMKLRPGSNTVVLCCDKHSEDRTVAVAALGAMGVVPVVPGDWSHDALALLFVRGGFPNVHLACEEGVEAWREVKGTGVMVGDAGGVLWWKALECQHAAEREQCG